MVPEGNCGMQQETVGTLKRLTIYSTITIMSNLGS